MRNLIVCVLGYRMVPNIQFIKERRTAGAYYLFISNPEMEKQGIREYIKKAFDIERNELPPVVVDRYSAKDLEDELMKRDFEKFNKILVNISEGTPIMVNVTMEFFKDFAADIFFIPDTIEYMIQVFPKRKRGEVKIKNKIGLEEYVTSYGMEMRGGGLSGLPFGYILKYLKLYIAYEGPHWRLLTNLRNYRYRRLKQKISAFAGLDEFLEEIEFPLADWSGEFISGEEICFLTGDWFEEFVYYRVKDEFGLSADNIRTGVTLTKEGTMNEFDVIFFYNGIIYTIECKTSIKNKEGNIMTDTIYKVKALQNNLGYYSDSNIFTLSSRENGDVRKEHIERGLLFISTYIAVKTF
ncbi:MAG: DUF1887 family protein [Tannerella sp.]|nr:DUF1887 family protein [Tannerella sp.]